MNDEDETPQWRTDYEALEATLGYSFRDRSLLENALVHSSYANEVEDDHDSNERLEFLGDAVIGLAIGHQLYDLHPDWQEGDLTRALHHLVDGRSLAQAARELGLGEWLHLGRTELQSEGSKKKSILADAMEAVLGALYLDGGLEPVTALSGRLFEAALRADAPRVGRDPKTELQETVMAARGEFPSYRLVSDNEIEGDDRRFVVTVLVGGEELGRGQARSKRVAEREAAASGLAALEAEKASASAQASAAAAESQPESASE